MDEKSIKKVKGFAGRGFGSFVKAKALVTGDDGKGDAPEACKKR